MRLIDADALIENHFSDGHRIAMSYADKAWMRTIIRNEPTIDAVPVVRCDKCWFRPKGKTYCIELERHTGDGFYCAFGQRREE